MHGQQNVKKLGKLFLDFVRDSQNSAFPQKNGSVKPHNKHKYFVLLSDILTQGATNAKGFAATKSTPIK
jgi:hypothetical protein